MLYIYGLTVHLTLQSVKAMTTHIKWAASSTHDSPVQLRLPFKASKGTLEGAFKWLEQWARLRPTAVRALHGLAAWVEESTTWGQQLRSAPSPRDFKLEHTGVQGRLPV